MKQTQSENPLSHTTPSFFYSPVDIQTTGFSVLDDTGFDSLYNYINIIENNIVDYIDIMQTKDGTPWSGFTDEIFLNVDRMVRNAEILFGFVIGTLRNYYYTYLSGVCGMYGMLDYNLETIENIFYNKVKTEIESMIVYHDPPEQYFSWEDLLTGQIIGSAQIMHHYGQRIRYSLHNYIQINYQFIEDVSRQVKINSKNIAYLDNTFSTRVVNIFSPYVQEIYDDFDNFYFSEFLKVSRDLYQLEEVFNSFREYVFDLETQITEKIQSIEWIIEILRKPVSSFFRLKKTDRDLYFSELDVLEKIIDDYMLRGYDSILPQLEKNIRYIIP